MLLALDLSLLETGYCVFKGDNANPELVCSGVIKTKEKGILTRHNKG
jgi:Holliday junction resolvasome RuvABC endonuclease subunit